MFRLFLWGGASEASAEKNDKLIKIIRPEKLKHPEKVYPEKVKMKPCGGSSPDHNENPFFCEGNGAEKKRLQ